MKQNKRKVSFWKKGISALRLMSTRLTIAFLAVLLIPTVLIGYFSYTSAKDQVQQKMTAPIQTILTMVGQHINNTVGERVKLLHYIDDLVGTNPGTEQYEEVRLDMNRFSTTYPEILDFSMANEQGKFITNSNIEETTSDVRNTEWYKSAISDGGKIHFSNITKDAASGKIYVEYQRDFRVIKGLYAFNWI